VIRHLLSAADLDAAETLLILDTAAQMHAIQTRQTKKLPPLRGRTIVNLFFEDSTRTRSSFEIAGKWLSADVINVSAKGSSASKGESLRDTALTVAAMGVDALVVRHGASGAAARIAGWVDCPVVNAGDGTHEHPTQALLDAYTLRGRLGSVRGRHIAIVGDVLHSRVARSNVLLLSTLGARITLVAPPTLLPPGAQTWGCALSWDLDATLSGQAHGPVDAVMMLRVQQERMAGGYFPSAHEYAAAYGLSPRRLERLRPDVPVLHPGPMNRGLEISSAAADGPRSAVLDQVAAGVAVRMAVLYRLLAGPDGAAEAGGSADGAAHAAANGAAQAAADRVAGAAA
jgi:aspartate carbamoyltransferase catalytic subunit